MMDSPTKRPGWTGQANIDTAVPVTVRRNRSGRNVDVVIPLPTPPHSHKRVQLPTPETVRRRPKSSTKPAFSRNDITSLPTPQTLPRQSRKPRRSSVDPASPVSPSGHTTFFHSALTTARPEGALRRRPGLIFAQQMGLLSQTGTSSLTSASFGGRLGVGVGMGGARSGGHGKVDQIQYGRSEGPIHLEDNPFIDSRPLGMISPGAMTFHRPVLEDDVGEPTPSPLQTHHQLSRSLLSPPPTRITQRIRTPPKPVRENAVSQRKKEEMRRMMDAEANPFLSHPGETIHPGRAGPMVDESRPTVTYVFRGAKKVFANPFLRPGHPFPEANLDPEDEQFEPHPCPKPKLLWPSRPDREIPQAGSSSREQSPPTSPWAATPGFSSRDKVGMEYDLDLSGPAHAFTDEEASMSESEDEEPLPARRGLLFAPHGGMKRTLSGKQQGGGKKAKGSRL